MHWVVGMDYGVNLGDGVAFSVELVAFSQSSVRKGR